MLQFEIRKLIYFQKTVTKWIQYDSFESKIYIDVTIKQVTVIHIAATKERNKKEETNMKSDCDCECK